MAYQGPILDKNSVHVCLTLYMASSIIICGRKTQYNVSMFWVRTRPCFPSDTQTVKSGRLEFLSFIKQLTTTLFFRLGIKYFMLQILHIRSFIMIVILLKETWHRNCFAFMQYPYHNYVQYSHWICSTSNLQQ